MGYPAAKIRQFLEAIEPEVIIECPACQTKFRIEASKLEAKDDTSSGNKPARAKARFHCSRCDYVFSADIAGSERTDHNTEKNDTINRVEDNKVEYNRVEEQQSTPVFQDGFNSEDPINSEGDIETTEISASPFTINEKEPSPQDTIHSDYFDYASGQIDRNLEWSQPIVKDKQGLDTTASVALPDSSGLPDETSRSILAEQNHQLAFNFGAASHLDLDSNLDVEPAREEEILVASPEGDVDEVNKTVAVDYSRYAQDFREEENPDLDVLNQAANTNRYQSSPISNSLFSQPSSSQANGSTNQYQAIGKAEQRFSTITTLAILILPIAIALTLLGATTLYLGKNLKSSEKLLSTLFPKAFREAPSGVFVQQPKLESLILDSGDIVNVVSGTIVNQSKKILTALTIEGMGFADSGRISISEKVLVGNPVSINNATLKTLTPSNIRELQSKEPKNFLLRPDGKTKFILVFTKPVKANSRASNSAVSNSAVSNSTVPNSTVEGDSNISSFAVRVYSARFRNE